MSPEVLEAPVVEQPIVSEGLPPMSDSLRSAFANLQSAQPEPELQPVQETAQPTQTPPVVVAEVAPPAVVAAPDYAAYLKETFGAETPEALKEKLTLAEQAGQLQANQRDPADVAIREMLADPAKARAYFDLQSVQPDVLAAGTPEQQRQLLFESYKVANPALTGRLAELGFNKEFNNKYALMDSEDPDEAEDAEFAKLQYHADLSKAVPAIKSAQEAAKIAPLPATGQSPTAEQVETKQAFAKKWLEEVDEVLAKPVIEQTFQVDGKPVVAAYDTKHADYKAFLDDPIAYLGEALNKIAYPNGDERRDMNALAQVYGQLKQPDAIAKSAYAAGVASVGAHVPMERLVNPAPDAPQPGTSGGNPDHASVLSKMRAVSTGRPY